MAKLSKYLADTSDLLHDQNFLFTSQSQLTNWVNEARRQVAQRTGCLRCLVSGQSAFGASAQPGFAVPGGMQPGALPGNFADNMSVGAAQNACQTIPNQERYPYQGFFNPFLQKQYQGVKAIIDTIACSVNWGGTVRPSLMWMPWDDLQAYARAYANLNSAYPYWWSVYNDGENGEIWLYPAPSTAGEIELDTFCVPKDLYTDDDYDALPAGFTNAVKFGAAGLAFLTSQRYAQANVMEGMFADRLGVARVAVDRGKGNYYQSRF